MPQFKHPCDSIQQIARASRVLAKTNYNYQVMPLGDHNCRCTGEGKPSFHIMSLDYFTHEATQHFAHEAVLFFVMMMTVALAFLNASAAVLELIRSGFQAGFPL